MSEEKLTVAELMARAAKEGKTNDAPRRRRRRSLEDGGISVAELTGSIPAVKDKPIESRHSSVPIDAPEEPKKLVDETPNTPTPAPKPAAEKVAEQPEEVQEPEAEQPVQEATARPAPSNEETMVLSIVDEKDPIRLTTGAFPVVPAAAVKANAKEQQVEEEAAESFDTTQMEAVSAETSDEDVETEADYEDESEDDNKMSVFAIILMAVVGIVLGVVVFLAFEMLWERLNNWLVGLLAIAVTLGMVGIIHALRTSRDGFSMVLAAIVGLVMTFGPLALVF